MSELVITLDLKLAALRQFHKMIFVAYDVSTMGFHSNVLGVVRHFRWRGRDHSKQYYHNV